jgi:hypothetical protein
MRLNPFNHRRAALTIWEVLIVLAVIATLAAIFLYRNYRQSAKLSRRIACVSNLKNIGFGFRSWAIDFENEFPMQRSATNGGTRETIATYQHFQVISNELNLPQYLVCPTDSGRSAATNFTADFNNSRVSYFVNRDANATNSNDFLAGDRNLAINGRIAGSGQVTVGTQDTLGWPANFHVNEGNILNSDGSVMSFSKAYIGPYFKMVSAPTNRLLFP